MSDLSDSLEQAGAQPKRVTVDGETVETHSPKDQIELDRYLEANKGIKKAHRGMYITKLVPPGTG